MTEDEKRTGDQSLDSIKANRAAYMRNYRNKQEITEEQRKAQNEYLRQYRQAHREESAQKQREYRRRKSSSSAKNKEMGIAAGNEYLSTIPEYKTELITELITEFLNALFAADEAEEKGNTFEYWKQKTISERLKELLKKGYYDKKRSI